MRGKPLDLTGQKFGRLTVLKPGERRSGATTWVCECSCGEIKSIRTNCLRRGQTKSCGCIHREKLSQRRTSHGMRNSPEYGVWRGMKERCGRENHHAFHRYGGRGIKVCDRWIDDFSAFFEDMGPRPFLGAELDRKDNDGDYEPDNCRWATPIGQANNRSSSRVIEFNGESKTLTQWARATGVSVSTLHARLSRGWSAEEALTKPLRGG